MSILILLFAIALWGIVHSLLASQLAKDLVPAPSVYRFAYNVFAVITFTPILYLMRSLPDRLIYSVNAPLNILMFGGQLLSILLLFLAVLQTDVLSFAGLRQLFEPPKSGALITGGLYRLVRHPLYLFILLFLWLTPTMTQNSLAVYLGSTVYIFVGAYFEEKKLLREFGEAYAEYKRRTPMIIPGLK